MSGRGCVLPVPARLRLNRCCSNGPCAFFKRILVKQRGKRSWAWMPWQPQHESSHCSPLQTITPINTTGTLLSAKPLAPNFVGATTKRVRLCQNLAEDIRSLAALYSRQAPGRIPRKGYPVLRCLPSCPRPLLMNAWKLAFSGRKQEETLYSKTKTDGANKALLFQLAWLLTVLVQVMRGNVTCHPIGLVVFWRWGPGPLVTTNEPEPQTYFFFSLHIASFRC